MVLGVFTFMVACSMSMAKRILSRNLGAYHPVTKESLKYLASCSATSHMSMSQQKVVKPNKQVSTLLVLRKLFLKVGIQRKRSGVPLCTMLVARRVRICRQEPF